MWGLDLPKSFEPRCCWHKYHGDRMSNEKKVLLLRNSYKVMYFKMTICNIPALQLHVHVLQEGTLQGC